MLRQEIHRRALAPFDFGLFTIAAFVVILVGTVTDLGLHAARVQRRRHDALRAPL